jgi:hypothetical protein
VAAPESRLEDSARFWTAAVLCRFFTGRRATQSGRGLPQSTTLTRNSFAQNRLGGHRIFETALTGTFLRGRFCYSFRMATARHPKATFFVQRHLFSGLTSFAGLEQKIAALPDEQSRGAAFAVFAEA